jgi:hypothetical protein
MVGRGDPLLELLDHGRLVPRTASRPADSARSRADTLRAKLKAALGKFRCPSLTAGSIGEKKRRESADAAALPPKEKGPIWRPFL